MGNAAPAARENVCGTHDDEWNGQMPLFGGNEDIPQRVLGVFMANPDRPLAKQGRKVVARESAAIMAETKYEQLMLVAHGKPVGAVFGECAVVVTDKRVFLITKGKVTQSMAFPEIAETKLGSAINNMIHVGIESIVSQQDFSPTDSRRFAHIMGVDVATPRIGNAICSLIDQRIAQ